MDPVLEEVECLCGLLGDRSVNSTEKETGLPGHGPPVQFGAQCAAASLPHFCFYFIDSVVKPGSNIEVTAQTQS